MPPPGRRCWCRWARRTRWASTTTRRPSCTGPASRRSRPTASSVTSPPPPTSPSTKAGGNGGQPPRYSGAVIADRIPVGWGRAVFVGLSVIILISFVEIFTLPIGHEHVGLLLALIEAALLALSVPLVLAVSSELAFVNRRRDN